MKLVSEKSPSMSDQAESKSFRTFYLASGNKFIEGKNQSGTLIKKNKIFDGNFAEGKL